MPLAPDGSYARHTAMLFPSGGYHWPGMGAEFERVDQHKASVELAEGALAAAGVPRGALRALMEGPSQVRRALTDSGWQWYGDFPLTMAAQTLVSYVLAQEFTRTWGSPALVVGESMGECAACAVAGALSLHDAVMVAWRWARALAEASDRLGLRMAVVEDLEPEVLSPLAERLQARVVVDESRTLVVVSIPVANLGELQSSVAAAGGSVLVSSNACVAHDPRLREVEPVWTDYDRWVGSLTIHDPTLPLLSALHPGRVLRSGEQVRAEWLETTSTMVRWRETIALLGGMGIRTLVQPCAPMKAYTLEKLRSEEARLEGMRIQTVRTLDGIERLGRARVSARPTA